MMMSLRHFPISGKHAVSRITLHSILEHVKHLPGESFSQAATLYLLYESQWIRQACDHLHCHEM